MKKRRLDKTGCVNSSGVGDILLSKDFQGAAPVGVGDILFRRDVPGADYDSTWTKKFNDRTLINVTACLESVIIFASKEG